MSRFQNACTAALLSLLAVTTRAADGLNWPQEVSAPEGTIVVYQPQPESLQGNRLTARAAFAIEPAAGGEPIFGAMWITSKLDTDRDAGTALVRDTRVEKVRWPDSRDAQEQRLTAVVEAAIPEAGFEISLERLSASLGTAEVERESLEQIRNDPPDIVFREELAVLLTYDGEPKLSPVEGSDYQRALNTPFLVVQRNSGDFYLGSGDYWYRSRAALGPWQAVDSPPRDLLQMLDSEAPAKGAAGAPAVVVATEPTELIASDGAPRWTSLQGGDILYVENTETPWLRDLGTGNMYVLLSGRWYRARAADGPWTFVRADELPAGFADIPPASDIGGLRVSVAGTEEAEDAMLDAAIPQTSAIQRSEASLAVEYDGEPRFEAISGTAVAYAVNTGAQVLRIDGRYYAVDAGVWFTSASATGPWAVADEVPEDEIAKIPPSSPVYNTTHVHIYESSPEVVYVGYTPGYLWSFPYYGVPVYGTGWRYPPYWGRYYYPRPPTWGFHVGYNPWTGWNFGVSWSNGFFNFGMSWGGGWGGAWRPWGCCSGWYGGGHRGPVVINTGDINIGNSVNIGNRANIENRIGNNKLAADRLGGRNIYQRPENRKRNASPALANRDLKRARPASGRANDVYADRSGAVARRDAEGWQTRESGQWQRDSARDRATPEQRDAAKDALAKSTPQQRQQAANQVQDRAAKNPPKKPAKAQRPSSRPQIDRRDLDRAHQARNRGMARERSRPHRAPARRR